MIEIFAQVWSWLAVAAFLAVCGVTSQAIAKKKGWISPEGTADKDRTWYEVTIKIHSTAAALLVGLLPWPTLKMIEDLTPLYVEILARCGWFSLAGVFAWPIYTSLLSIIEHSDDVVNGWLDQKAGIEKDATPSEPPKEP